MAVGALATLAGPGRTWLTQPPLGDHQSAPICPLEVRKNTFINDDGAVAPTMLLY